MRTVWHFALVQSTAQFEAGTCPPQLGRDALDARRQKRHYKHGSRLCENESSGLSSTIRLVWQ
jgi:hypothetical protein